MVKDACAQSFHRRGEGAAGELESMLVTMSEGILNLHTQLDMKASVMVEALMEESGMASNQREKRSQQVNKYLKPWLLGTGPTRSR